MTAAERHRDLVTGNRQMDEEHALQLSLLRELVENLDSGDAPAALEVFERLEAFTRAHFLAEELLMRLHAYPASEAHAADHAAFVRELQGVRARLADGPGRRPRGGSRRGARRRARELPTSPARNAGKPPVRGRAGGPAARV
ncbi:MAG TPA: hemerythrin family protein [Thermoanaerobaculia bacterium]|nr:hemerythrin family protein [Thermoanaerobaculia bacterium]